MTVEHIKIITDQSTPLPTAAELISITDTGDYFTATDVEGALQELGAVPTPADPRPAFANGLLPTGAIAQTLIRTISSSVASLISGQEFMQLAYFEAGQVVTSLTHISATTAAVAPTNQWFSLRSLGRVLLGITNDDTTTAWPANTPKTLDLATPYTITESGYYYIGRMVKAGTVPTLFGIAGNTVITGIVPIVSGSSNSGLTTPATAPATANALIANANSVYAYAK